MLKRLLFGGITLIFASSMLSSCVSDEDINSSDNIGDEVVRVSSVVMQSQDTRAYQEDGDIVSGTYYMTYHRHADPNTFGVCDVNFYDKVGVTTTSSGYELKWQDVGSLPYEPTKTAFWLDNVPRVAGDPDAIIVPFTEDYNPFVAGEFDKVDGKNDLLWGYQQPLVDGSEKIRIGVHHYMSRVNVVVTVDNSHENAEAIDFTRGSVKITNVIHSGVSYNRTTGRIDLGTAPEYNDLYLTKNGDWASITPDPEQTSKNSVFEFQSKNFVLPPQELLTNEDRPRLVLEVPQTDGSIRTYSGVIPRMMLVNNTPAPLAFDVEKNLTLKVKLSQDLLYIVSIYAYVQDWVDKGVHLVTGNQAGIYSEFDLQEMIAFYNELPDRQTELIHYGYLLDGKWNFDVFENLEITASDYAGKMKSGPDFEFDFTYHTLTIIRSDGSTVSYSTEETEQAAQAMYNLLRYGTEPA